MTVSTHEVRASQTATPVLVQATEPVPGLRIYLQPEELRKPGENIYLWRIGHHSGLSIAKFETRKHAEAAAEVLATLTDWTQGTGDLEADHGLRDRTQELVDIHTAGIFLSRTVSGTA